MSDFYDDMQQTASELLKEFNQGTIIYTPVTQPANGYGDPVEGTPVPLDATASGPSKEYLSPLITTSDVEITAAVFGQAPTIDGRITIDGTEKEIIAIKQIPAAGTPVAWKIWVKG